MDEQPRQLKPVVGPPTEAELAEWERQFTYNPSATAGYGRGTTEPVQRLIAEVRRLREKLRDRRDQNYAEVARRVGEEFAKEQAQARGERAHRWNGPLPDVGEVADDPGYFG